MAFSAVTAAAHFYHYHVTTLHLPRHHIVLCELFSGLVCVGVSKAITLTNDQMHSFALQLSLSSSFADNKEAAM